MKSLFTGSLLGVSRIFLSVPAHADVVVINNATLGSVYDGILDCLPLQRRDDPRWVGHFADNALAAGAACRCSRLGNIIAAAFRVAVHVTSDSHGALR